jgi:hypothetical protein
VDALVAFTIPALAMGALLQGFATGPRDPRTAEAYAIAVMQACCLVEQRSSEILIDENRFE